MSPVKGKRAFRLFSRRGSTYSVTALIHLSYTITKLQEESVQCVNQNVIGLSRLLNMDEAPVCFHAFVIHMGLKRNRTGRSSHRCTVYKQRNELPQSLKIHVTFARRHLSILAKSVT